MATLLDLLVPYPVLVGLVSHLSVGELVNLSRANAIYRATLHNFPLPNQKGKGNVQIVRPSLLIGHHETKFWKNLKAKSIPSCSEPQHKPGSHKVKPCRICSALVCEACIIKASFGKQNENISHSRSRNLCSDCWSSSTPHKKQLLDGTREPSSCLENASLRGFCTCSARDGHLCLGCKTKQKADLQRESLQCYGYGCSRTETRDAPFAGRVCLWCDLPLPRSRAESRREYDTKHLIARSHSTYERPFEEDQFDSAEEQRMLELDALARAKNEATAGTVAASEGPAIAFANDPSDQRRVEDLTSQRRYLAHAASREEQRWQRSESFRRPEWNNYPAVPIRSGDLPRYDDVNETP